jgi:hypothetical protein
MLLKLHDPPHRRPDGDPDPFAHPSGAGPDWRVLTLVILASCALLLFTSPRGAILPGEAFAWFLMIQTPQEAMRILREDSVAPLHPMLARFASNTLGFSADFFSRQTGWIYASLALPLFVCIAAFRVRSTVVVAGLLLVYTAAVSLFLLMDRQHLLLTLLMSVAAWASMLGYFRFRRWWWVLLCALAMSAALWADNSALIVLVGLHIAWVIFAIRRGTKTLVALAVLDHLVLAMYIPWMPSLVDQLRSQPWPTYVVPMLVPTIVLGVLSMPWMSSGLASRVVLGTFTLIVCALATTPYALPLRANVPLVKRDTWNGRTIVLFHPNQLQLLADHAYRDPLWRPRMVGLPNAFRAGDPPRRSPTDSPVDDRRLDDVAQQLNTGQYDRVVLVTSSNSHHASHIMRKLSLPMDQASVWQSGSPIVIHDVPLVRR